MTHPSKTAAERIRQTRLFLLDLDGTVYLGDRLIAGATEFIGRLRQKNIPYVFLTNNSSKSADDYVKKINRIGIPATRDNVFTSGQAAGVWLTAKKRAPRVFVLGTRALAQELARYGCRAGGRKGKIDFVVAGFDTELDYKKLMTACELLDKGVPFIATNPDWVCPIDGGRYIPDCGSMCFMIEKATGRKPYVIGKPRPDMVRLMCGKFGVAPRRTAVIGDRLYTDIAVGKNAGALSICVLSGESTTADIKRSEVKPDIVLRSIDDLNPVLSSAPA
jgi:phosphoglycolate/pyridoxal phosphate phosphatase family enzyme